jgi:hypothetical protein
MLFEGQKKVLAVACISRWLELAKLRQTDPRACFDGTTPGRETGRGYCGISFPKGH